MKQVILTILVVFFAACGGSGKQPEKALTGRLVDAERNPAVGWRVRVDGAADPASSTDDAGRFALRPLAAGTYRLTATPPRGEGFLTVVVRPRAETRDLGYVVLPAGLWLHVAAEGLQPGAKVRLQIDGAADSAVTSPAVVGYSELLPGTHVVRVEADSLAPVVQQVDLKSGVIRRLEVAPAPPSLAAVAPAVGEWNDLVIITGTGLAYYAVDGEVRIGGVRADVDYWLDDEIGVRIPAGVEPGGQVLTLQLGERVLTLPLGIRPTLAAAQLTGDGRLVLDGVNLGSLSGTVLLSGPTATAPAVLGWTQASVTVAVDANLQPGAYTVFLTNQYPALQALTVNVAPRPLAPLSGSVTGAAVVVIDGANFGNTGTVTIGSVQAEGVVWSADRIEFQAGATVPPGVQALEIWVNGETVPAGSLTVEPVIGGVSPAVGAAGDAVVITGSNLGTSGTVTFGSAAAVVTAWSPTAVTVAVPNTDPGTLQLALVAGGRTATTAFTVQSLLASPTSLQVTLAYGRIIHLAWIDNATIETAYLVEREAGGAYAAIATLPAGATVFDDAFALIATSYTYRVVAVAGAVQAPSAEVPLRVPHASALGMGGWFTCVVQWLQPVCWGHNANHQVAPWATTPLTYPTQVTAVTAPLAEVFSGFNHACAIAVDGSLWCWGANDKAQAGLGFAGADITAPTLVQGVAGVVASAARNSHSCVLDSQQRLFCWGNNANGQVGQGGISAAVTWPSQPSGMPAPVSAVAAGFSHTCALGGVGVACWGFNSKGQIGDGLIGGSVTWPTQVTSVPGGVVALANGANFSCALLASGKVWCWGENNYGQLGSGRLSTTSPYAIAYPVPVTDLVLPVVALTAGNNHACARLSDGSAVCWGRNKYGQLGATGTPDICGTVPFTEACSSRPVAVVLSSPIVELKAGAEHTCARNADGSVDCWGFNRYGQLGNGEIGVGYDRTTPVPVAFP